MKKLLCLCALVWVAASVLALSPEELVRRVNEKYSRVRDAHGEITLDAGLQLFGCGGIQRKKGYLWFKAPDKLKAIIGKDTYYVKGNLIRKIDGEGKRFYVRLLHAPDFSVGFNPGLITSNFNVKQIGETSSEVILEGLPKPGVLKNVKKVIFRIDQKELLLRGMDLTIKQGISGKITIKYENIGGLTVPVSTFGKSALEMNSGILVGLTFNLTGYGLKVNTGLPDRLFEPGF